MTDIRQHLSLIFTSIKRHIVSPVQASTLVDELRAFLPGSYGVGCGRVVDAQGQVSDVFDLVIYDKTIPQVEVYDEPTLFSLRCTLAVALLAYVPTVDELEGLLTRVANAKQMRMDGQEKRQRRGSKSSSLKRLLPLGIVAFHHFSDLPDLSTNTPEALAMSLDGLLRRQTERPDYLIAQGYQLFYSNPVCKGEAFTSTTINIHKEPPLAKMRSCYVCKQPFSLENFFYRHLCLACGDENYAKRPIPGDLEGRIALVTGGRVKIGYASALRLLRAGAQVLVTTRFPHDAAQRYSCEADFASWQDRLQIYGLDFRSLPVLEHFITHLFQTYSHLDILINNAAQTVRQPDAYYAPLLPLERRPLAALPLEQQALLQETHRVLPLTPLALPANERPVTALLAEETSIDRADEASQLQILGGRNSWTFSLDEIGLSEFLEVQVINVTAPFLLLRHLRPLLQRSPFPQRFIVNVSAIEGQFANEKQGTHVHTNMAKASLNMLTHTVASELAREGIFLNSVDPGWISQQAPVTDAEQAEKMRQLLPLDLVDAAARVCDPIFMGILSEERKWGIFYKDYHSAAW